MSVLLAVGHAEKGDGNVKRTMTHDTTHAFCCQMLSRSFGWSAVSFATQQSNKLLSHCAVIMVYLHCAALFQCLCQRK